MGHRDVRISSCVLSINAHMKVKGCVCVCVCVCVRARACVIFFFEYKLLRAQPYFYY